MWCAIFVHIATAGSAAKRPITRGTPEPGGASRLPYLPPLALPHARTFPTRRPPPHFPISRYRLTVIHLSAPVLPVDPFFPQIPITPGFWPPPPRHLTKYHRAGADLGVPDPGSCVKCRSPAEDDEGRSDDAEVWGGPKLAVGARPYQPAGLCLLRATPRRPRHGPATPIPLSFDARSLLHPCSAESQVEISASGPALPFLIPGLFSSLCPWQRLLSLYLWACRVPQMSPVAPSAPHGPFFLSLSLFFFPSANAGPLFPISTMTPDARMCPELI